MTNSLFTHEAIRTTLPKAKELRRVAEPLITLGKNPTLANRRLAFDRLRDREVVTKLFDELGPRFKARPGGYLRILKFGHRQGDHILVAFAQALQRNVRSIDAVVRYGGDEFLVVLLETDAEGAGKACERIRKRVVEALERSPAVPDEAKIGVSVGLAVRNPGENIDDKLAEADQRMYSDKRRTEECRELDGVAQAR